jgi:hypothetical protein
MGMRRSADAAAAAALHISEAVATDLAPRSMLNFGIWNYLPQFEKRMNRC